MIRAIIGHTSADFDCLASMIAAKKIYTDAVVLFPGAIEENVRKFLSLYGNTLYISNLKEIDISQINELIVVDTSQKNRIGQFASLLSGNQKVKVIIYDHHPSTENDINGDISEIRNFGATVTILLEKIIKQRIAINTLESTLFALGIYEDTGSLTFSTTTQKDIAVLSHLFSIGVNLRTVNKFTNIGLNIKQKKLLNQLILSSKEFLVKGIGVVFAKSITEEYIEGLALVTHKLIEILNADVIFVLVMMKNRIYIVGRSNRNSVNVGEILKEIGGGGHSQAASAVIRKISLMDAEKELKKILDRHIEAETIAKNIMTTPVKTINVDTTIEEASKIMLRYGHNGFPVMRQGKLVGIITRQEIYKAKHHRYEDETVDVYMSENIIGVNKNTPILEIQELMIKYDVGRVLVLSKEGRLEGIITRTDLIRSLYGDKEVNKESFSLFEKRMGRHNYTKEKIQIKIKDYFPKEIYDTLHKIGQTGDELNYSVFVVGGIVRDLFLDIPNLDLDIVVEEDAIQFAKYFCKKVKGRMRVHQKFKTAVVILPNDLKIDFASARREFYEYPAALPKVEFASIKKDLYRRDFTINAMAIQLNQDNFGKLLDFYGGKRDLELKKIRILYSLSFTEDPARIIRAIRFEQRYDFTIEKSTEKFLMKAVTEGLISRIRKKRLSEEFITILQEKNPIKILKRMEQLGVLSAIIPDFRLKDELVKKFTLIEINLKSWYERFPEAYVSKSILYLYYLLQFSNININQIAKKIELNKKSIEKLNRMIIEKKRTLVNLKRTRIEPSNIYYLLKDKPNELLFVLFIEERYNNRIIKRIKDYYKIYKKASVFVSGNDLTEMGLKPNPNYSKILKLLFYLQINGIFNSKDEEISFVRKLIKKGII